MGKPTGFMEYEREENESLSPKERIRSYSEFHPLMEKEKRQLQGARCMNCGIPFCQSGTVYGGMVSGCPLHNLVPEWNDELFNGNWEQALARLMKTNNFPEFTGRVCPALCEAACTCGLYGEPVTIRENELAIVEEGYQSGWFRPQPPVVRSEKKVAIIGSGPAGLAAADQLNHRGHKVTVWERDEKIGGLLRYGIPNMKLDKTIIDRRLRRMEAEGVEFKTGEDVGRQRKAEELLNEYDAVILACGAKMPRELPVPGRTAQGVWFAVEYLSEATRELTGEIKQARMSAAGKNVIVVGGGDTGNDCVGTSIRQGCRSICQLELLPPLPEQRAAENPWPQWPRVRKTDYGQEEAIAVFGADPRRYQTTVKELIADSEGRLTQVVTVRVTMEQDTETGLLKPREVEGSEETLPCELLLIAAGFTGCEDYVAEAFGVTKNSKGVLKTPEGSYATGVRKVFAAGDARRGQSLVVWAIAEGRACAKEVDAFLMGYTNMI